MCISRIVSLVLLVCAGCVMPVAASAQVPTADDFLPVVQGGPSDVKQPQQVAVKGKVVSAATAQDAVNAAVGENVKGLKNGETPEVGAKMVTYPSGLGFVATGVATYRTVENPTLTRIAKRKAYVIAFTKAKKNLAEILGGLDSQGKETVREALVNVNLPKEEMTNISTESQESLKQAVEMMLRGFVIYEVKDDTSQNTVFVSIVTTPKTRGQFARPAPNAIEAAQPPRRPEPGYRRGPLRTGATGWRKDHYDAFHRRNGLRRLRQRGGAEPAPTRRYKPNLISTPRRLRGCGPRTPSAG